MYFVKYQPLKRKLKERTLSDREAVRLPENSVHPDGRNSPEDTGLTSGRMQRPGWWLGTGGNCACVMPAIQASITSMLRTEVETDGFDLIQKYHCL